MKEISDKKRLEAIGDFIDTRVSDLTKNEIIFGVLTITESDAYDKKQLLDRVDVIINVYRKYSKN